jgi:membrane-associated protein
LAIGVGIAAFVGDQVGFIMGRHLGRPYLDKKAGPRMSRLIVRVDRFYLKYGWWSVVVARFMPWARVLIPWIAGIGKMNYTKFLTSNLVGAIAWGVGLSVVGFFAASIPSVRVAAYIIGGTFITLSIIFGLRTWLQDRRERREQLAQSELSAST